MLSRCPIQFQRRYGARFDIWHEEEILPPGIALLVGSSTHKSVETNLKNKMETGELLPIEEVKAVARDEMHRKFLTEEVNYNEDEAVNIEKTQGQAIDMAIALSGLHHIEIAPALNPLAIEEPFVLELQGYPFDIAGQIDVREESVVRDTKTSGKSMNVADMRNIQFAMYSLAHRVLHEELPKALYMDILIKTKTPRFQILESVPDETWISPLMHRIERFAEIVDAEKSGKHVLTQADPNSWVCSKRYCGYAQTCPFWTGR